MTIDLPSLRDLVAFVAIALLAVLLVVGIHTVRTRATLGAPAPDPAPPTRPTAGQVLSPAVERMLGNMPIETHVSAPFAGLRCQAPTVEVMP